MSDDSNWGFLRSDSFQEENSIPSVKSRRTRKKSSVISTQKQRTKKRYVCDLCSKEFTNNCGLTNHMLVHAGVKPFSCEICHKSFTKKCTLTVHLLTHSTDKPHVCEICNRSFARKNDLQKHNFVHTNEKKYTCDVCKSEFKHKNNLRRHKVRHFPCASKYSKMKGELMLPKRKSKFNLQKVIEDLVYTRGLQSANNRTNENILHETNVLKKIINKGDKKHNSLKEVDRVEFPKQTLKCKETALLDTSESDQIDKLDHKIALEDDDQSCLSVIADDFQQILTDESQALHNNIFKNVLEMPYDINQIPISKAEYMLEQTKNLIETLPKPDDYQKKIINDPSSPIQGLKNFDELLLCPNLEKQAMTTEHEISMFALNGAFSKDANQEALLPVLSQKTQEPNKSASFTILPLYCSTKFPLEVPKDVCNFLHVDNNDVQTLTTSINIHQTDLPSGVVNDELQTVMGKLEGPTGAISQIVKKLDQDGDVLFNQSDSNEANATAVWTIMPMDETIKNIGLPGPEINREVTDNEVQVSSIVPGMQDFNNKLETKSFDNPSSEQHLSSTNGQATSPPSSNPQELFSCGICDAIFEDEASLLNHVSTHSNYDHFKCYLCGENFTCNELLNAHILVHTDISMEDIDKISLDDDSFTKFGPLTLGEISLEDIDKIGLDEDFEEKVARMYDLAHFENSLNGNDSDTVAELDNDSSSNIYPSTDIDNLMRQTGGLNENITEKCCLPSETFEIINTASECSSKVSNMDICVKSLDEKFQVVDQGSFQNILHISADPGNNNKSFIDNIHHYTVAENRTESDEKSNLVNPNIPDQPSSNELKKAHACHICDKSFARKVHLQSHYLMHWGLRPYSCKVCQKSFTKKSSLTIHSLIHSGEKRYSCSQCEKRFSRKTDLVKHNMIHEGEMPYVCEICQKRFNHQNNLRRHKITHSSKKPHVCKLCNKEFPEEINLISHMRVHLNDGDQIPLDSQIINLLREVKAKLHKCDFCGLLFARHDRLLKHQLLHSLKNPYLCEMCGDTFPSRSKLQVHVSNHIDIDFGDISDNADALEDLDVMQLEPSVHSLQKAYTCDQCFKVYPRSSALKCHYLMHTGEKPFKCPICQKCFGQRTTLKRHVIAHSGIKLYACDLCHKSFAWESSLRKHYASHAVKRAV